MSAGRMRTGGDGPPWVRVALAAVALAGVACAVAATRRSRAGAAPVRDYSDRSGFPGPPDAMRGRAREGFFASGASATPLHLPDPPA
jgi:hypothetical protein